jgi:hypothetical protein
VSALGVDTGPIEEADPDAQRTSDLNSYPHLQRLEPELSQDHSAAEFEESLENLLTRIAELPTA